MSSRAYIPFMLGVVVLVAVLGMPLMLMTPMHHEMGCPFAPNSAAICATNVLEHVRHWQLAFASVLAELLLVAACALVAVRNREHLVLPERNYARIRLRSSAPERPTLFQELFSRGILNRKDSCYF